MNFFHEVLKDVTPSQRKALLDELSDWWAHTPKRKDIPPEMASRIMAGISSVSEKFTIDPEAMTLRVPSPDAPMIVLMKYGSAYFDGDPDIEKRMFLSVLNGRSR